MGSRRARMGAISEASMVRSAGTSTRCRCTPSTRLPRRAHDRAEPVAVHTGVSAFEQLRDTMAASLGVTPDLILENTRQKDLSKWDSLAHINLMVALESNFDVSLEVDGQVTNAVKIQIR